MGGKKRAKRGVTAATPTKTVAPVRGWVRNLALGVAAALASGAALAAFVLVGGYLWMGTRDEQATRHGRSSSATHVGDAACAGCHQAETAAWQGSHHALAMEKAQDGTVLGDFNNANFTYFGVTSRFFRRDGRFFVNTDGRRGDMADFPIAYTIGVFPLQQYLIEFPDGRLQTLSIAWDARAREAGGQRWFHLYPDQPIRHGDILHWTGINQNWNFMCAECHTTELHKNYDAAGDRFRTAWAELGVSCEACHGPGSRHVAWAEHENDGFRRGAQPDNKGLLVTFGERAGVTWTNDKQSGEVRRSVPPSLRPELETCGRCHARRAVLAEDWLPGRSLSSTHLVSLLEPELYHDDGQIEGEVYEYGSFRQSKMFAGGVTCSDCHDPHSLERRAAGDGLCVRCHSAERYATPKHHFHGVASPAPTCGACHMPARTYMGVHVRHDHSFRVPRPDLSAALGTPNTCNDCHQEKSARWAADAIERWHGPARKGQQNFAEAFYSARHELPEAGDLLDRVAKAPTTTGIARSTAFAEMAAYLTPQRIAALRQGLVDADPLVRLGALRGLDGVTPERRWALAAPLLDDPVRAIRIEAISFLADTAGEELSPEARQRFDRAAQEYVEAQRFNADRPEARAALGAFFARRGRSADAEIEYRAAIRLMPNFVQAYINLADLYRSLGREREGEAVLRQASSLAPDDAAVAHALGLALVRQHRLSEALACLGKAAELDPRRSRYAYVYGVALNASARHDEALGVLKESHLRHQADRDTLLALISFERDAGDRAAASRYAAALAHLMPGDPTATRLVDELRDSNIGASEDRRSDPPASETSTGAKERK